MESKNRNICAVLVTYNRLALLKECLAALEKNENVAHIVIVNNKSTDGTADYLATLSADKFIIKNSDENLGGAGGFAHGIVMAYEQTDDQYFWIMDDDTIPNSNAAHQLLDKAAFLKDDFGFLCSNVRWMDGTSCNMPMPAFEWPDKINDGLVSVSQGTFVSVFLTREIVKQYGVPTQELFIWGDDTEYTIRVSQAKSSYFVIDSVVVHKTPNNLTDITIFNDSKDRINRYFYLYRNLIYISKLYKGKGATIKLTIRHILYAFSTLGKAKDSRFKRAGAILKGTFTGLGFNPQIRRVD